MKFFTKEKIKNEVKSLSFKRKDLKNRSKILQREAQESEDILSERKFYISSKLKLLSKERARYVNVAYALLKGIPYSKVEKHTRKKIDPSGLLKVLFEFCSYSERKEWDLNKIEQALSKKQGDKNGRD